MKKLWLWVLAASASVVLIVSGSPALAVDLRPEDGFDVSYPQCGRTLPAAGAFSIIGVDGGRAFAARNTTCLNSQLSWAKNAGSEIQLYANTGNPGGPWIWDTTVSPRQKLTISKWPSRVYGTNSTKPLVCTAAAPDTYNCAYDYGYRAAYESFQRAKAAFAAVGIPYTPDRVNWWLDIEWGMVNGVTEGNTWRGHDDGYIHPNDSRLTMSQKNLRNIYALRGMHDYLVDKARVKQLGFYSSPTAWSTVVAGTTIFADHPFWYPIGPASNADAVAKCTDWTRNVTGAGQPVMVQYVDTDLDLDMSVRCDPATVVSYAGALTLNHGAKFTLKAKLMPGPNGTVPLHGQQIKFDYRGRTYTTRTDKYGYARVYNMIAPATAGTTTVTVRFLGNSYAASSTSVDLSIQ